MKIAIPADENKLDTTVCMSFGRTPFYLIYDTESKQASFLENLAANSAGGAGIKAAQAIVDSKSTVVLTPRCGENAANVLYGANVEIFKTTSGSAMDNVNAYISGSLAPLNDVHPGFHNHGN
jgi:predicted Fe-Mo cluster-binding NifX family protein